MLRDSLRHYRLFDIAFGLRCTMDRVREVAGRIGVRVEIETADRDTTEYVAVDDTYKLQAAIAAEDGTTEHVALEDTHRIQAGIAAEET